MKSCATIAGFVTPFNFQMLLKLSQYRWRKSAVVVPSTTKERSLSNTITFTTIKVVGCWKKKSVFHFFKISLLKL